MKRGVAWVAIAIVLLGNLAALVHVWRNRADGAASRIELSERELRPPPDQPSENSAVMLELQWLVVPVGDAQPPGGFRERWNRFIDPGLLEKMGLDTHPPEGEVSTRNASGGRLARLAYGAFELDGEGWRLCREWYVKEIAQQTDSEKKHALENELALSTRLVFIDGDRDAGALRARHRDPRQVLILPVVATLNFVPSHVTAHNQIWESRGRVDPVVTVFNVPREFRAPIDAAQRKDASGKPQPPQGHYTVTLACGARDECWVEATRAEPPALHASVQPR